MNDTLKNILRKDETVLWAGAPEPVEVLEKPHVPLLIVRWAVCAVLGVLLIAYLTYFSVYVFQVENQARIVVGVVLAACIFVALRPFMDAAACPNGSASPSPTSALSSIAATETPLITGN